MENSTYVALSKLMAQERVMDVVANNVANGNTPGYRAEHVLFSDWLRPIGRSGVSAGDQIAFAQDRATWADQSRGSIEHTGEPLDLALGQDGFFSVSTPGGIRLTRSGRFSLQGDGSVVDSAGNALLDDSGHPINVPSDAGTISVSGDGTLSTNDGISAKIGVVSPADDNQLVPEGAHLLRSGSDTHLVTRPGIVQGAIESSNVSTIVELTQMMQTERQFQFVSQFTEAEADRQQNAIDKLSSEPGA